MSDNHRDTYDFGSQHAQTYRQKCECGTTVEVSTQKDVYPEYYTEVHVRCQKCNRSVGFVLPVN